MAKTYSLKALYRELLTSLQAVYRSLAFWPSLLSISFILLAFGSIQLEQSFVDDWMAEHFSWTQVSSFDTANSILSTIAGGTISLTVFSFSMVMLMLNQTNSSFSPRLLPGLINSRSHQLVLGVYLGTINYTMLLMFNVRSATDNFEIPSLGVLGAVLLMGLCMGLFIYFIHNISQGLQIEEILKGVFHQTQNALKEAVKHNNNQPAPLKIMDEIIVAPTSGYLQEVMTTALIKYCQKQDIIVSLEVIQGDFVLENTPLCRSHKALTQEQKKEIQNHFVFYARQLIQNNYIFGLRQFTEVAIKALSPGINDPATAISVLDNLAVLFLDYLPLQTRQAYLDEDQRIRLIVRHLELESLLRQIVHPILHYGKTDVHVVERIIWLLQNVAPHCVTEEQKLQVQSFAQHAIYTVRPAINSPTEKEWLNQRIQALNTELQAELDLL